jgi:hypothetical protein
VETGQPLLVDNYQNYSQSIPIFRHPAIGKLGIFPIPGSSGKIIGVLTPLNSIIGFSELLQRQGKNELTERQINHIQTIAKSGQHLLQLISEKKLTNSLSKLILILVSCIGLIFSLKNKR